IRGHAFLYPNSSPPSTMARACLRSDESMLGRLARPHGRAAQLAIDRQCFRGATIPGEASSGMGAAAPQRLQPGLVLNDLAHALSPALVIVRINQVGVPAGDFGD